VDSCDSCIHRSTPKVGTAIVLVLARDLWNQISTIPKSPSISVSGGKTSTVDSTNCLTFLEFLLPDQSPKQRWLELQKLVSLRESRNPGSHQCFFDRDTKDRKHMLRLVRGALGPLHRATAFDGEQECRDLHLSGNLQDG
jgi:hypothetical protein